MDHESLQALYYLDKIQAEAKLTARERTTAIAAIQYLSSKIKALSAQNKTEEDK